MTETQQRFLRAIAERVPTEQVVELHLFPPIRQGGVETGVAVVAEDPRRVPAPIVGDAIEASSVEPTEVSSEAAVESGETEISVAEPEISAAEPEISAAEPEVSVEASNGNGSESPPSRFTIHTARYRLTLKGVDRGKWEVDVVAEADAPLEAVDKVVRGVQRRAGEGTEPDRLSADAFREALDTPLAQLERA
jgi:hypothetical protein